MKFGTEKLDWCGYPMVTVFFDHMITRFDTIHEHDRQQDRQTDRPRALVHSIARQKRRANKCESLVTTTAKAKSSPRGPMYWAALISVSSRIPLFYPVDNLRAHVAGCRTPVESRLKSSCEPVRYRGVTNQLGALGHIKTGGPLP